MRLLLDTHIWIWSVAEPDRLSRQVARGLEDPENELWLSPVSVWETLLLARKGRIEFGMPGELWIDAAARALPTRDAALTREVAIEGAALDLPHQDPADRFIAATAVVYDLTLVSGDTRLLGSTRYRTLPNRER